MVAIPGNKDGYHKVLGAAEDMKEDNIPVGSISFSGSAAVVWMWLNWWLVDKCLGMLEAVGEVFPEAKYQQCTVNFCRNVFAVTPHSKAKLVAKMLKAIHAQESKRFPETKPELW